MAENLDEQIETIEDVVIDGADEEVIECVLNSALGSFTWDDIMNFSSVCWSWRMVVRGQLTSRPLLFDLFKQKYPDEEARFSLPLSLPLSHFSFFVEFFNISYRFFLLIGSWLPA